MTIQKQVKKRKSLDSQAAESSNFFTGKNAVTRKEESAFFVQKAEAEEEELQTRLQREEEEEMQTKMMREEEEEIQEKVQRQDEEEEMQTKLRRQEQEDEELQAKTIQKKEEGAPGPSFEETLQTAKKGGAPLPDDLKLEMEGFFGKKLGHVRVHDDETSADLCNQVNAQAFAHGNHIFFNKGKYQPGTSAGKHLLTHELTHIVQQGEAR